MIKLQHEEFDPELGLSLSFHKITPLINYLIQQILIAYGMPIPKDTDLI